MDFGMFLLSPQRDAARDGAAVARETADLLVAAEERGFAVGWVAEHHFSNLSVSPSPLMTLAHCAGRTSRIRLGTGVLVLPLYQPMRLAEEIAYVDAVSGGRLVLGVGAGSQNHENRGLGTDLADAHGRFLEVLDILEQGFREGAVDHRGTHFTIPHTPLSIRPVQRPHPPVWLAGMSGDPAIARRVAERGYVAFSSAQTLPIATVLQRRREYEAGRTAAGLDPAGLRFALQRIVYVTDDRADARDAAAQAIYTMRVVTAVKGRAPAFDGHVIREVPLPVEPSPEDLLAGAAIGDPEHVAEKLAADIEALGPCHLSCFMQFGGIDRRRTLRSMDLFAGRVIPLLERRFGDLAALGPAGRAAA